MLRPFRNPLVAGFAVLSLGLQGCDSPAGSNTAAGGRDSIPTSGSVDSSRLPFVVTHVVKEINRTQATAEGEVAAQDGYKVKAMGICWLSLIHISEPTRPY